MTGSTQVEQLAPLDLPMPTTYIRVFFAFETIASKKEVVSGLQRGLDKLSSQLPWLCGIVYQTTSSQGKPSLQIRSNADDAPTVVEKGSIQRSYQSMSASEMTPDDIPVEFWPAPGMIDGALSAKGAPVFAASVFGFPDNAVGLCVCVHHNAVDATGFSEVMRLWAQIMTDETFDLSGISQERTERLSTALSPALDERSDLSVDDLFARHPEYSQTPPAFPEKFPSCTSKVFRLSAHWINVLKELLHKSTSITPTTNSILSALIWSSITRARLRRDPTLEKITSRLCTAVNIRKRIDQEKFVDQQPYFGNAVVYSLSSCSADSLAKSDETPICDLAKICDEISQSYSETVINSSHIAEVCLLVEKLEDYRSLFVGWDLFGSRDITITSWADLGLYEMSFGALIGYPQFIRMPFMEADGVAIVLPRKRAIAELEEQLEVMIMLRADDMASLETDSMWQTLGSARGAKV